MSDVFDPSLVAQTRALMGDVGATGYLTDDQVHAFVAMNGGNARLAAADALEAIAVSEVLVGKVIKTQDLSTDGRAVAEALLKLADRRRAQGQAEVEQAAGDGFVFTIAYPGTGGRRPEHTNHEVWGL